MDTTALLKLIVMASLLGSCFSLVLWSLRLGITPTPTSHSVKQAMSQLLPCADQVKGEIHELGAGWGHLLPLLSCHYPQHPLFGHERSPLPRTLSKLVKHCYCTKATLITAEDIFTVNLSQAGLVVCYLYTKGMEQLAIQLKTQLPENCWVISHTFRLPGWLPVQIITSSDLYKTPVYLYRHQSKPSTWNSQRLQTGI